jgi:hypothetical protein
MFETMCAAPSDRVRPMRRTARFAAGVKEA